MKHALGLVLTLLLICETPAQAYADPGSGLFLWQLFAAASCGILYQLRKLLGKHRK